jgi:hypothetical protein
LQRHARVGISKVLLVSNATYTHVCPQTAATAERGQWACASDGYENMKSRNVKYFATCDLQT